MKLILGKKLKMDRIYVGDKVVPVTAVLAGPCQVIQIKTKKTDGYEAAQLGFGVAKKVSRPRAGHLHGLPNYKYISELRLDEGQKVNPEQMITVEAFKEGEFVKVSGVSKGKGFQGVVKRHGFHGHAATHGNKDQERMPGSIGSTDSGRVFKGVRMAGRMGGDNVTVPNLKIVKIDIENNVLYLTGAVPGATGSLVFIKADGILPEIKKAEPIKEAVVEPVEEVVTEPVIEEVKEVEAINEVVTEEVPTDKEEK